MYLRSITMKGFKSFPSRTRLEFGPGTSVIVGPNGSGKSNVTDAVLWALGEQSPGAVRGQSMQDVIFGGAPGRQAGSSAEVELVLDDREGRLGLGTPEVSIVRRLDRGGEGEYRLAGARCRLVDVLEVLSDTGLGKEMHSVISQGRVEAIVTSKPRDRRLLIEEAAGLGKHRKRRRRAQLKLSRTQENLDRALDVEREARSRLRPLKRQAEAAELHARLERQTLEARWELSRERLRHGLEMLERAAVAVAVERGRRDELEARLAEVARLREEAEEALATRSARREELSRRSFQATSAAERIGYRAEGLRAAQATVEGRLEHRRAMGCQLRDQARGAVIDPEAAERLAGLQTQIGSLERDREAEAAAALGELEAELSRALDVRARREAELEAASRQREHSEAALDAARREVRQGERGVETARREAARVGGELAAVNQFLRTQAASAGGGVSLSDALEVTAGYELALAAALDGRLAASLVQNLDDGMSLLGRSGEDGGRALVRAENGSPDISIPTAEAPAPEAERLVDHLRGDAGALGVARMLLTGAWVVADLAALPRDFTGLAVTRSGRVWSAATRELRQAPAHGAERVLAERNRRDSLIAASERAAGVEHDARRALAQMTERLAELDGVCETAIATHRGAVRARDEADEAGQRISAQIARRRAAPDDGPNASELRQLQAELAMGRERLERQERARIERARQLERLEAGIELDGALIPVLERVLGALSCAAEAVAAQQVVFEAELAGDREAGERLAAELRRCAQAEAGLHGELRAVAEALTAQEVGAQRARDAVADAQAEVSGLAERLELEAAPAAQPLDEQTRAALSLRVERLGRRREQLGPVNPLAEQEYAEAVAHVEELEGQRGDLESALRELAKLIADTNRQIRETFEKTFAAAAENFEELSAQLFPGGRGRLRLVSERDGPARVIGGQELVTEEPEADGEAAPAAGEDAAEGGHGEPSEGEDGLGVEIEITPAGKAMKRLSLLSGGEKSMTALAFLFSVFLAKPCPFYILDEVEAALDDLNIDRFLALLAQYSKRAQFIVVTHQKRTMEAADSLYGVSMGGDGISKVISRRLPVATAA